MVSYHTVNYNKRLQFYFPFHSANTTLASIHTKKMTTMNQLPPNSILISKESSIPRTTDFIDSQLERQTEVQLRCAGTSVEKGILIAEKCVALGIAQYSRFTTQLVPFEGREVLYTIIKLKRVPVRKSNSRKHSQDKVCQNPYGRTPAVSLDIPGADKDGIVYIPVAGKKLHDIETIEEKLYKSYEVICTHQNATIVSNLNKDINSNFRKENSKGGFSYKKSQSTVELHTGQEIPVTKTKYTCSLTLEECAFLEDFSGFCEDDRTVPQRKEMIKDDGRIAQEMAKASQYVQQLLKYAKECLCTVSPFFETQKLNLESRHVIVISPQVLDNIVLKPHLDKGVYYVLEFNPNGVKIYDKQNVSRNLEYSQGAVMWRGMEAPGGGTPHSTHFNKISEEMNQEGQKIYKYERFTTFFVIFNPQKIETEFQTYLPEIPDSEILKQQLNPDFQDTFFNSEETHGFSEPKEPPQKRLTLQHKQYTENDQGVQIYYTSKGDVIYTQEAYKQPFSQQNVKAYIEPAILPQKLKVENDNEKSQELNRPVLPGVPQALISPQSAKKVIIYRKEEDLDEILDYLGMEEQKQPEPVLTNEIEQKQQEKKQKESNVKSQPQAEEYMKPIRMFNISDLNGHNVSQEQIQITGVHSLADRPHPIINPVQRTISAASVRKEAQKTRIAKKTTRKKQFFKANTGRRFTTPLRYDDDEQSRSSQIPVPDGSFYRFERIPNKDTIKKNIVQVRRSSRIETRSRAKRQGEERMKQIRQDQNENLTNTMPTNKKQEIKQSEKDSKKSKSKSIAKSVSRLKTESQEEQITIQWLKEHFGEFNQIVINDCYMENEYNAMIEKDQAISRFLQELQDGNEKIEYVKHETKEEQPVRQNRLIKPSQKSSKKGKTSKKTSMKSKSKLKSVINQNQSKSKANIKIERTVDILIKNNSNQDNPESQIDNNGLGLQNRLLLQQEAPKPKPPNNESSHSLSVQQIVDPDILGFGIYALVKLGSLSESQFGTKYAITPRRIIKFARRKHVLMALQQSKKLVSPKYSENIARIGLNQMLIELIEKATLERNDRKNQRPQANKEKEGDI